MVTRAGKVFRSAARDCVPLDAPSRAVIWVPLPSVLVKTPPGDNNGAAVASVTQGSMGSHMMEYGYGEQLLPPVGVWQRHNKLPGPLETYRHFNMPRKAPRISYVEYEPSYDMVRPVIFIGQDKLHRLVEEFGNIACLNTSWDHAVSPCGILLHKISMVFCCCYLGMNEKKQTINQYRKKMLWYYELPEVDLKKVCVCSILTFKTVILS